MKKTIFLILILATFPCTTRHIEQATYSGKKTAKQKIEPVSQTSYLKDSVKQKLKPVVQVGHTATVNSVSFSPDGKFIASGSRDGSIRIWNVKTGRELLSLWNFDDAVLSVAADGRFWGKGNYYKYLVFVDEETGRTYSSKQLAHLFGRPQGLRLVRKELPPYLEIQKVELFDEDRDMIFSAGEKGTLSFEIANKGKGSAYELERPLMKWIRKVAAGAQKPEVVGDKNIPVFPVE